MDYASHIPRAQLQSDQKKLPLAILAEPDPNYNPLQYPANIDLAKEHGNATRVCKSLLPENSRPCMCCGKSIENYEIDIFCEFSDLNHLGVSYPLYYYFKRSSCIMMLLAFLISGIYQITSNNKQNAWLINTTFASIDAYSVIGYYIDPSANNFVTQTGLILAANFVIFFLIQYFKGQQKKLVWTAHRDSHTPADYAVLVSGLDNLRYSEADLMNFFNNDLNMHHLDPVEVKKVNLTYDIKDLDDLHRKRAKLIHERRKLDSKLNYHGHSHSVSQSIKDKANDLDLQIAQCETDLEKLEQEYVDTTSNFFRLSGCVFMSLNTQRQSKNLQKRFKMKGWKRFLVSVFGCVFNNFAYKERVLNIERAPQPTDVLFENLAVSSWTKLGRTIKSYIMTFITIIISSLILFGISFAKTYETNNAKSHGQPEGSMYVILSYAASFVVVIINQVLVTIIKKFCSDEHHYSYTHFYRSIARKLVVAQFINTALVPLFVRLVLAYYFQEDVPFSPGTVNPTSPLDFIYLLANDMMPIFEINAISTPLLYIFDTSYYLRLLKRRSVIKDAAASDLSQCEVNSLFEGPALDIASRYAGFVKTIWAAAFYSFLIPLAVPISVVGLYIGYVVDRYLLARRFSTPIQLGKDLSKAMAGYIKEWVFFSALGNLLFGAYFFQLANPGENVDAIYGMTIATLVVAIINMAIPFKIYRIFVKKEHILSSLTWENVHLDFTTDYDRANPVTQAMAEEQVIREALEVETDPMRRSSIMNLLGKVQVRNAMEKGHVQGLYKYAATHQNLGDHYVEHSDGHAPMPAYVQDHGAMNFSKRFAAAAAQNGQFGGITLTNSNFVPNPGPIGFAPVSAYGNNNVVIEERVQQPHHHHHHKHNNNF